MKLPCVICIVLILGACQSDDTSKLKQQIIDTDRNFSKMASEKGIAQAFIYYADEKVIKPNAGQQPVVGKFALLEWYKNNPAVGYTLVWEPLKAEVSGQLGYTFGGYTLVKKTEDGLRDTTHYGTYISIWKQKKDGTWRYVFDTGNPTPGPVVLQ
jgi:ketosteroid isomerase-like protein